MKFGRLSVMKFDRIRNHRAYWKCHCDCGNDKIAMGKTLLNGGTTSCGCYQRQRIHETSFKDISGQRFGSLTAMRFLGAKNNSSTWECKCDCGNMTEVSRWKIISGHTKSCGCLHSQSSWVRAIGRNKKMVGNKHPRWRSDLTDEERRRRKECRESDPKLNRWRTKVYARDHYTCQKCKDPRGGNLNAHHICSWAHYPRLRYIASNGITLCRGCHKDFHSKFGIKRNTRKQLTMFMYAK